MNITPEVAGQLLALAVVVESVTEYVKALIPKDLTEQQKQAISLIVGLVLAVTMHATIFTGSPATIALGTVISGLIVARGSNYTHDFLGVFEKLGDALKQKSA